ncbi:DEAD/DEAH box helicase [Thalassospira sp.]|uniref:DEAD/DEAH box helicase n=1 Tax=Thalassospira sp. TaxID=1912094 RepID=UPI0027345F01|nr:DEAD/DEAH box helicase [Thalassospira sp.]MDP2697023.1 DEAD/DEAH box helicase [Thalassospira sp.]
MNFADLGLSEDIVKAVTDAGYDTPTPIQQQAIPSVLMGRDILGCAQTGTGKTAGFTLPMLDILHHGRARMRMPRSIILEPTRELATQVAQNFDTYGKYMTLSKALVIGGESFVEQQKILERGADVLIATPGRLIDTFERGKLLLSDCKLLVIDEADRMLDMGFIPDIEKIVAMLPKQRQTLFFSATMPKEIRRLADKFLSNPKEITVAPPATMAATVDHRLAVIDEMDKRETLRRLIRSEQIKNAFVFCNRKKDVDILYKSLVKHGFNAGRMHGDLVQSERTETLDKFKSGEITLLVCSDVAARGIDVADVSHVFNFDVPFNADDYVHRTGRTGRAGRAGKAFTLAMPEDGKLVQAINKAINMEIPLTDVEGIETLELDYSGKKRRGKRPAGKSGDSARSDARPTRNGKREGNRDSARANERKPATPDAAPVAVAAPVVADKPRTAPEPRRNDRTNDRQAARPAQSSRPAQPARDNHTRDNHARPARRERHDYDRDDKPVTGLGDHVPAFLMTAVPASVSGTSSAKKAAAAPKAAAAKSTARKTADKPAEKPAAKTTRARAPRKPRKPSAPAENSASDSNTN